MRLSPHVDLVVLHVDMAMHAIEILDVLSPVVFPVVCTVSPEVIKERISSIQRCLDLGCSGYITMPCSANEVARRCDALMHRYARANHVFKQVVKDDLKRKLRVKSAIVKRSLRKPKLHKTESVNHEYAKDLNDLRASAAKLGRSKLKRVVRRISGKSSDDIQSIDVYCKRSHAKKKVAKALSKRVISKETIPQLKYCQLPAFGQC